MAGLPGLALFMRLMRQVVPWMVQSSNVALSTLINKHNTYFSDKPINVSDLGIVERLSRQPKTANKTKNFWSVAAKVVSLEENGQLILVKPHFFE